MLHDALFALWFLLPAAAANAAPIASSALPWIKHWNAPMDGGRQFRGKPIFGAHKTWRGLISGMLVATLILWLQQKYILEYDWAKSIAEGVDYQSFPTLILGPLFGIGALGGDAIESFFKRQRGFKPGETWIPFDQLDYIIGSVLVSLPFVILSFIEYVLIFVLWFLVHIAASYIGWKLKLKAKPI